MAATDAGTTAAGGRVTKVTQVTHNDLDGYGASTLVACLFPVDRVEHVTRYADVGPVFGAELARLAAAAGPELLIVTDIAVEKAFAEGIAAFAAMNARRERPHGLVVIDHHASSAGELKAAGLEAHPGLMPSATADVFTAPGAGPRPDPAKDDILVLIDPSRSATGLCLDNAGLMSGRVALDGPDVPREVVRAMVEAVDAVDLWRRERDAFDAGEALNDAFWEVVQTYLPPGNRLHDAFVSKVLLDISARIAAGGTAAEVEADGMRVRTGAVDWLVAANGLHESPKERAMSSRMRVSRLLARSDDLFVEPIPGRAIRMCHAMDPGIFQRVSDFMLDEGGMEAVINVMRGGNMSFRSRDGQALELAAMFGGGGHENAAGARLGTDAVFSLGEATRLVLARVRADVPEAAMGTKP